MGSWGQDSRRLVKELGRYPALKKLSVYIHSVIVYMCALKCMGAHICAIYIWRPEVDGRHVLQFLSTLFIE